MSEPVPGSNLEFCRFLINRPIITMLEWCLSGDQQAAGITRFAPTLHLQ